MKHHVGDLVWVEAVVGHAATVVEAEFTVAGFLFVEDHSAIHGGERVQAGFVFGAAGVVGELGDAVYIRGEASAAEGPDFLVIRAGAVAILYQSVDPVFADATEGGGDATLGGDAVAQGFGATPAAVAVDDRVTQLFGDVEDASGGLAADMVGFDHHLAAHQFLDQEVAQVGQATAVTQVPGALAWVQGFELFRCFRETVAQVVDLEQQLVQNAKGLHVGILIGFVTDVFGAFRAFFKLDKVAGFQQVAAIEYGANTNPGGKVRQMAAEGVVEFVHGEHVANAQLIELVQPFHDVLRGAFGHAHKLSAAHDFRHFDAQHHGHLALANHFPGLGRAGDNLEPAFTRAAVLSVYVVLHFIHALDLQQDGFHGVAVVLLLGVDAAEQFVMHLVVDQDFHAVVMGTLQPAVVTLVVLQGVVTGPVVEGGPALSVVGACAAGDQLEETGGAPGAVGHFTVFQGMGYAKFVERRAVVDAPTDELVGGNMGVGINVAEDVVVIDALDTFEAIHFFQVDGRATVVGHLQVQAGLRVFGAAFGFGEGKGVGGIAQ